MTKEINNKLDEFYNFVDEKYLSFKKACKKLFTDESLKSYKIYKLFLESREEYKRRYKYLCNCDRTNFDEIIYFLDKYMVASDNEINKLKKIVDNHKFESC